ncbi:unnamed protein product [Sympodiomycopsis kandeliae]
MLLRPFLAGQLGRIARYPYSNCKQLEARYSSVKERCAGRRFSTCCPAMANANANADANVQDLAQDSNLPAMEVDAQGSSSQPLSISSGSPTSDVEVHRKKKRKVHIPPASIQDHLKVKQYLYVTDLVGPVWCEYSYQYNIMGMTHLPISQRPESITLPSGKEIRPSTDLVQKRDKIVKAGTQIHAKLEREIHPEKVSVQTKTYEDQWALRLLKLIIGLRSLIDRGCVRELPVFGWAENYLVTGIIDEIEKRPLSKRRQAQAEAIRRELQEGNKPRERQEQQKLPFPTSSEGTSTDKKEDKTWSSQEEWRAHQRKVEGVKKLASKSKSKSNTTTKSPRKSKSSQETSEVDSKQQGLKSFFSAGPSSQHDEVKAAQPADTDNLASHAITHEEQRPLYGFYLTDTKTRTFNSLPNVGDQRAARLQTMIYKRMLDGLCQGALERASPSDDTRAQGDLSSLSSPTPIGIRGDPDAVPFHFTALFDTLSLEADQSLSEAFRSDAQELLDEIDVTKLPLDVAAAITAAEQQASELDTPGRKLALSDLVHVVDQTLIELMVMARRQSSVPIVTSISDDELKEYLVAHHQHDASAIQTDLCLVYRLQERRKKRRPHKDTGPPKDTGSIAPLQDIIERSLEGRAEIQTSQEMEDGKGFATIALPEGSPGRKVRRSQRLNNKDAKSPEVTPPNASADTAPSTPSQPQPQSQSKQSAKIIGRITFPSLSYHLTSHIKSVLSLWNGTRSAIGVSESETYKCRGCEWFEGCEWRHGKGEEKRLWASQQRKERLVNASLAHPPEHKDESQYDEESLWANFDDDAAADDLPEQDWEQSVPDKPQVDVEIEMQNSPTLNATEQDWVEQQADSSR